MDVELTGFLTVKLPLGCMQWGYGATQHRWGAVVALWLPSVTPVPVVAAAGESLTASVPPPAVYGYTPEQRVGTRR